MRHGDWDERPCCKNWRHVSKWSDYLWGEEQKKGESQRMAVVGAGRRRRPRGAKYWRGQMNEGPMVGSARRELWGHG